MIDLPCPTPSCSVTEELASELGAHLIADHGYERAAAAAAKKALTSSIRASLSKANANEASLRRHRVHMAKGGA